MKRALFGIGSIAALFGAAAMGTASAADMAVKAAPAPVAAFSWAGWYVGANVGGGWARASDTVNFAASAAAGIPAGASLALSRTSASTVMGGGQIGYNWQSGHTVTGIEVNVDGQHYNASQTLSTFSIGTLFVPGDVFTVQSNWQASLLGRLGYAWDRTLLYATGGLAVTNVKVSSTFVVFGPDPATAGSSSTTMAGATFGGGLEYALASKVSVGVEGRYTWYGTHTYNTGTVALGGPPPIFDAVTQNVRFDSALVVGKLNYHF